MRRIALATLVLVGGSLLIEDVAVAQYRPSPRSSRRLRRNPTPPLSPYLNLIPGAANSFTGQYLLRTQPFEQIQQQEEATYQQLQGIQRRLNVQEQAIRTGLTPTGKRTSFMNLGGYFGGR
jgi:hypothetical protein